MPLKLLRRKIAKFYCNLSLQDIITVPFLLQIFIIVGLVGYFSFRNGQQAVNEVADELRNEVTSSVKQHLQNYLEKPQLIVQLNQKAAKLEQLSFDNIQEIEIDFWQQIKIFDSVYAIYLGNEAGKFAYVKREADGSLIAKPVEVVPQRLAYRLDARGKRSELLAEKSDRFDPRVRPWYLKTTETNRNNWSQVYTFAGGELGITAAGALYDSQEKFQGVVGVDLVLSHISDFLKSIKISDCGQIFILERNGYLVATSTDEEPFIYNRAEGKEKRLKATDSQNLLTKLTSDYLTEYFENLYSIKETKQLDFEFNGDRQLMQVLPYRDKLGLDWLIVVVVSEADFMAEIHANTRDTIWLCLGALSVATVFGIYTSRRIAKPITHLSRVSSIIAQSARSKSTSTDLYPVVKAKSIRELQVLAASFNEMGIQLKAAFQDLEQTNEQLEMRVAQRTAALIEAKEAADAANKAKSTFLAHMTHELRTPLHAILGFTQISLQDPSLKPQQRDNLTTIKRSGEHLLSLINDVLEMSKIEAGKATICETAFDLHLLLQNLAKMFEWKAHSKNLELFFGLSPNVPQYIRTDPMKLRQVLINLIGNGIKFTQQGKVILRIGLAEERLLSTETQNQQPKVHLIFEVQDTGCGIPASKLESIFAPFSQTKQINQHQGSGLGLAISQQFVRMLGGEITVKSILGKGSLFRFQIPITVVESRDLTGFLTSQASVNKSDASVVKDNTQSNLSSLQYLPSVIKAADFANMSPDWIFQLRQAAIAIDAESILQLIEQIPPSNSRLAQGLTRMLANFEYDEIIELTELASDRA